MIAAFLLGLALGVAGSIALVALALASLGRERRPEYDDSCDSAGGRRG